MSIVMIEKPIGSKAASEMLGVSIRTIIRMAERGEVSGFMVGKRWKFYPSEIEAYIAKQRQKPQKRDTESS